jgi:uncharacterized phiE125 gp8 family phage protein
MRPAHAHPFEKENRMTLSDMLDAVQSHASPQRSRLLQRVTAPASEPLTLSETKLFLRVDATNEDTLITDLITAARMDCENWLRRSLITQTWKLAYDDSVPDGVGLPMGPVIAVSGVNLIHQDGSQLALDTAQFRLNAARDALLFSGMVTAWRIEITYSAGYGTAVDIPGPIRQGMLAHVASLFENRGDMVGAGLPEQVARLYMPFREVRL